MSVYSESESCSAESDEGGEEAILMPSHQAAPKIRTNGFTRFGQDSATYSKEEPSYVRKTVKVTRDELAFIKSTSQLTGIEYRPDMKFMHQRGEPVISKQNRDRLKLRFVDQIFDEPVETSSAKITNISRLSNSSTEKKSVLLHDSTITNDLASQTAGQ